MEQWQAEMRRLKIQYFRSISKEFYRLNGGENMVVRPYSDSTSTGLIDCIIDYLGYHGCCTEPGPTICGYASIKTDLNGQPILITIQQKKMKNRKGEVKADPHQAKPGQLHFNAVSMPSFMNWFKQLTMGSGLHRTTVNCITTQ